CLFPELSPHHTLVIRHWIPSATRRFKNISRPGLPGGWPALAFSCAAAERGSGGVEAPRITGNKSPISRHPCLIVSSEPSSFQYCAGKATASLPSFLPSF